jgi:hypothetical protein
MTTSLLSSVKNPRVLDVLRQIYAITYHDVETVWT